MHTGYFCTAGRQQWEARWLIPINCARVQLMNYILRKGRWTRHHITLIRGFLTQKYLAGRWTHAHEIAISA